MNIRGVHALLLMIAASPLDRQPTVDVAAAIRARREERLPVFRGGNGDRWSVPPHGLWLLAARRRRSAQTHRHKRHRGGVA